MAMTQLVKVCNVKGVKRLAGFVYHAVTHPIPERFRHIQLRHLQGERRDVICERLHDDIRGKYTRVNAAAKPKGRVTKPTARKKASKARKLTKGQRKRARNLEKWARDVGRREATEEDDILHFNPTGFYNPSVLCYRNAVLQCLLHVPAVYRYVIETHNRCAFRERDCIACALKRVFAPYWQDHGDGAPQANFPHDSRGELLGIFDQAIKFNCRGGGSGSFEQLGRENIQNDASEFLNFIMSELEKNEGLKRDQQHFRNVFQLATTVSWTCEDCDAIRPKDATDNGIEVPLGALHEDGRRLEHLIDGGFVETMYIRCGSAQCTADRNADEELPGNTGLDEDGSKLRQMVTTIRRGPDVLCVKLNRHGWEDAVGIKVLRDVDYPEVLDLSNHSSDGTPLRYRLFGVAAHRGATLDAGHWIAVVRHRDGERFVTITDTHVRKRSRNAGFDPMRRPRAHGNNFDPSLLVYVKIEGR